MGLFRDGKNAEISDRDEDPDLFGFFVQYIYRNGWGLEEGISYVSDILILARLYCMAERLGAGSC